MKTNKNKIDYTSEAKQLWEKALAEANVHAEKLDAPLTNRAFLLGCAHIAEAISNIKHPDSLYEEKGVYNPADFAYRLLKTSLMLGVIDDAKAIDKGECLYSRASIEYGLQAQIEKIIHELKTSDTNEKRTN
jgi:hypothetical protein